MATTYVLVVRMDLNVSQPVAIAEGNRAGMLRRLRMMLKKQPYNLVNLCSTSLTEIAPEECCHSGLQNVLKHYIG